MKDRLTPEQSVRLIELGVDPSKASGEKVFVDIHPEVLKGNVTYSRPWGFIPIFTLTDILSLIPKEITDHIGSHGLRIEFGERGWSAYYVDYGINGDDDEPYADGIFIAPELIDALYELLCWTLTRGKNEKGKQ